MDISFQKNIQMANKHVKNMLNTISHQWYVQIKTTMRFYLYLLGWSRIITEAKSKIKSETSSWVQWFRLALSLQGTWVRFLVEELRLDMPCGVAKKTLKMENNQCWWGCKEIRTHICCWWEYKIVQPLLKTS